VEKMKTGFLGPRPEQRPVPKIEEVIRPSEDGKEDRAPRVNLTSYDFTMGRHLGDGSFSQVETFYETIDTCTVAIATSVVFNRRRRIP